MTNRAWTGWSFLILGLLTAIFGVVILTIRLLALQRWTNVQGEVLEAAVNGPDYDEQYSASVTMTWKFDGKPYSKRFAQWGNGGTAAAERIVTRYKKGSTASILCDPAHPSNAFFEAGYTLGFLIAPVGVILGGLTAMILGYFIKP